MRRLTLLMFLLFVLALAALPAYAQDDPYYPSLTDPVDQAMQRLAVMSQKDERIAETPYNNGKLGGRGCKPVSIANGLIASFGVTDQTAAAGIVLETTQLLCPGKMSSSRVELKRLPDVLDAGALSADEYPYLSAMLGAYPGTISVTTEALSANAVLAQLEGAQTPAMLVSFMYVNNGWEDVVRILVALHDMGMDDATLCLSHAGAGMEDTTAPLRSGENGHYLGVLLHVGSFMKNGTVYVLDSLPRAISGESAGYQRDYSTRYSFTLDDPEDDFNTRYEASRISPTIIRLSFREVEMQRLYKLENNPKPTAEEQHEALIKLRTRQLRPLMLYGSCVMMVSIK